MNNCIKNIYYEWAYAYGEKYNDKLIDNLRLLTHNTKKLPSIRYEKNNTFFGPVFIMYDLKKFIEENLKIK